MPKTYIHIGLHKTATTFLQTTVFPTLENTLYLSRPYTQLNHAFNKLQYADDTRFNAQDFLQEFSQFDQAKRILISDEMFSGIPNFNYINRSTIAHRLHQVLPEAEIILFLRGQLDLILSLYNTWIKNLNGTQTLESFLFFPSRDYPYHDFNMDRLAPGKSFGADAADCYYFCHDRFTLNLSNFFYDELVSLYKGLFNKVHVFLFEDFRKDAPALVSKLEQILGDRFHLDSQQLSSSSNVSLKGAALEGRRFKNSIQALTSNKVALKLAELSGRFKYNYFPASQTSDKQYLNQRLKDFYQENNLQLTQNHPEISLGNYPSAYQL